MSDFLEQTRKEIAERMRELEPLIEEYRQLEAAASALAGVSPTGPAAAKPAARRRRASGPGSAAEGNGATRRRGRPPGSGSRAREALELVGSRPGITIPEIASEMGIKQNYLYRVLPALEQEGKVVKRERGWHATGTAAQPT